MELPQHKEIHLLINMQVPELTLLNTRSPILLVARLIRWSRRSPSGLHQPLISVLLRYALTVTCTFLITVLPALAWSPVGYGNLITAQLAKNKIQLLFFRAQAHIVRH